MAMTVGTLMSADELLRLPDDGSRYELVRGELRTRSFAGALAGAVAADIMVSLGTYVDEHGLGEVVSACGFQIGRDPDTVRAPSIAFIRADRVIHTPGYFDGAPDAAFEVVSFDDADAYFEEKAVDWLCSGCRVVVVVNPEKRMVRIHRASGSVDFTDAIVIDDVIPGWKIALHDIFE